MMTRDEQARLLFTLLDAAEGESRFRDPAIAERWLSLKARFDNARSENSHSALVELFEELDRTGAITGTWIQARWFAAKARGENSTRRKEHQTLAGRPSDRAVN